MKSAWIFSWLIRLDSGKNSLSPGSSSRERFLKDKKVVGDLRKMEFNFCEVKTKKFLFKLAAVFMKLSDGRLTHLSVIL